MTMFKACGHHRMGTHFLTELWSGGGDLNLLRTAPELKGFDGKGRPGFKLRGFKCASPGGVPITVGL